MRCDDEDRCECKQRETERAREALGALHVRVCGSMKLQQQQQIIIGRQRERTWLLSQLQTHTFSHIQAHLFSHPQARMHMHTHSLSPTCICRLFQLHTHTCIYRLSQPTGTLIGRLSHLSHAYTHMKCSLPKRGWKKKRCAPKTSNEFRFLTALCCCCCCCSHL